MKYRNDTIFYVLFFIISLLILWDLLTPGYILTLDMVFVDRIRLSDSFYDVKNPQPSIPFKVLVFTLNKIFPMWLIQKIILLTILFLCGVFAYRLCPTNKIGRFFAGLIYTINPFVFVRFLAGHFFLLISYMFLPLMIESFIEFFREPTKKNIIKTTLALTSVTIFSTHFIPIVLGIFFLFLLFNLLKKQNRIKPFLIVLIAYSLLNSYWVFPLIINPKSHVRTMQEWIGPEHLTVFKSRAAFDFNVIFNLASMHGFWRAGYDYAKFHVPFWYLLFFLMVFLSVHGFLTFHDDKKYGIYVKAFPVIFTVSLILAAGITYKPTSSLFIFLFENVPFFRGFREPQKFVALVVLTYSFLGGMGLGDFVDHVRRTKRFKILSVFLIILSLATPFVYSYTMFFGFHDQLETVWYPQTWYEVDEYLSSDKEEFNVLFLPWHGYMDFRFNPKQRLANPARAFFSKPIIQGDNVEVGPVYSQSTNPISKYIEFLLFNNEKYDNLGELLSPLNIKYIILAKEVDWKNYLFLKNQTDLELVMENPDLMLFKNRAETAKVYETDTLITTSWEELISKKTIQRIEPIEYTKESPVEYILQEKPTKEYIVFTEGFSEGWRYGKQKPEKYLGVVNVFKASEENTIYYQKFNYYLVGYVVSTLTFVMCAGCLIRQKVQDRKFH